MSTFDDQPESNLQKKLEIAKDLGINPQTHGVEGALEIMESITFDFNLDDFHEERIRKNAPAKYQLLSTALEENKIDQNIFASACAHITVYRAVERLLENNLGGVFAVSADGEDLYPKEADAAFDLFVEYTVDSLNAFVQERMNDSNHTEPSSSPPDLQVDEQLILQIVNEGVMPKCDLHLMLRGGISLKAGLAKWEAKYGDR